MKPDILDSSQLAFKEKARAYVGELAGGRSPVQLSNTSPKLLGRLSPPPFVGFSVHMDCLASTQVGNNVPGRMSDASNAAIVTPSLTMTN